MMRKLEYHCFLVRIPGNLKPPRELTLRNPKYLLLLEQLKPGK
jgi:hypothetical protein